MVHRTGRYQNNRAEVSHQHTREQERQMRRFKSMAQVNCFIASYTVLILHLEPFLVTLFDVVVQVCRVKARSSSRCKSCPGVVVQRSLWWIRPGSKLLIF